MSLQYLYQQRDANVAALVHQQKDAALALVGLAAIRWIDTRDPQAYNELRYAVCRYSTYDNLAAEADAVQAVCA